MCINVSPKDAYDMIRQGEGVEILDVRTPMEYQKDGYIKGAKLLPINEIQFRFHELNPEKKYLIYCRTGNRSGQVCQFLTGLGFKDIYNQAGGVLDWNNSGFPLEGGGGFGMGPGFMGF
jgi:rhodanese-related sulfurtransferase